MTQSMIQNAFGVTLFLIASPGIVSILTSIVMIVYFGSLLKINVVDLKYNGSWKQYFKSWFKRKKNLY